MDSREKTIRSVIDPLILRCRAGTGGFVIASHTGQSPNERFLRGMDERVELQGLRHKTVRFSELGPSPVSRLVELRKENQVDIFFILCESESLWHGNDENVNRVNALNLQRSNFAAANLCAVFVVQKEGMRLLYDHASNFLDFRLAFVEVPAAEVSAIEAPRPALPREGVLHNLPFPSLGRLFVGRERELEDLRQTLAEEGAAAITQPVSISGLGGIGKTRLAVEFAWRRLDDYDAVLFVRADTPLDLKANIAALSDLLHLSEASVTDLNARFETVLKWLEFHRKWLLIIDNSDTEESTQAVQGLLPRLAQGDVLITSRFARWGIQVSSKPLDSLTKEEAVRYLLIRSKGMRSEETMEQSDAEDVAARLLADKLGYLPLGLEQAAAYIANRGLSFRQYLREWDEQRESLLRWHQPEDVPDYPFPVAVTFTRSFEGLSISARAVLRLCAWLAPDPIPEDLVTVHREILAKAADLIRDEDRGGGQIEDKTDILDELAAYSMIRRHANGQFTVHRMVQEVLRVRTPASTRKTWVDLTLQLIAAGIPEEPPADDVRSWPIWDVMRSHVAEVAQSADRLEIPQPTAYLMNRLGVLLLAKALYRDAEPLMRRALEIDEGSFGPDHPTVAIRLNNLAQLLQDTNRLADAEPLMRRAIDILEKGLGPEHPNTRTVRRNYERLLIEMGRRRGAT